MNFYLHEICTLHFHVCSCVYTFSSFPLMLLPFPQQQQKEKYNSLRGLEGSWKDYEKASAS